ncbi:MAG TPA: UDP-N-acetylmuramoyl-L-alanyl-D-glutamate--2,6-diaminopimelate ligase [Candidatus Anaerotruncus excrementipullorum]|uniref:UDP-N-acetylmuramoyl-L-alanyl-D-glutamate--2,6-diaminopimelate ligase n=1 Tax=Candidatus Anaerotruncus excrementipullorum TaxID=2838465 RepID=A0A9D1WQ59_9FIRM|nr:UDP-N-acetylmuramoyl-L-alanyl-D-glutamate--2,6-diaminopimelate ligase [Candidatus Anaerotruncus excrementipullorum]
MRLQQLLAGVPHTGGPQDCEITGITSDSRQVEPGMLFVCIQGARADGHAHAPAAVKAGAAAVVCQRDLGLPCQVLCPDTRLAYGLLCANWYGNPARRLRLIGVTGTNGKTSVTCMVKQVLESAGHKAGLIGTIHNEIDDLVLPAKYTTPDPLALHSMFHRMVGAGCEFVVMECSSHALDQQRLAGLHFETGVFTNLTQDHLDYHHTMENYFLAKKSLFDMCKTAVLNLDDAYGRRLAQELNIPRLTFSIGDDRADYTAKDLRPTAGSTRFMLVGKGQIARVELPIPGEFSVSNAMAAAAACLSVGLTVEQAARGLSGCRGVAGRIEVLPTGTPYTVIRDYAHTPDGLEKILEAMRPFTKGRLLVLFGCAGNRDPSKRGHMGEIAARLADGIVLTSDNPRDEDEMTIIHQALEGVRQHPDTPCQVIPNRYDAIEWALDHAQPGDTLVLAGKGHEDYQVLHGETICFDERQVVAQLLEAQKKRREEEQSHGADAVTGDR